MPSGDLTPILQTIIMVIIAPLMPIVALKLRQWVDANVSLVQRHQIEAAVRMAVLATEQLGLSGAEAKTMAIKMAQETLDHYRITVNVAVLAALIEAEVLSEFNHPALAQK